MIRLPRILPIAGVALLAVILNIWNIGFPLGFHPDEENKVDFIRTGTQDFKHPLLLLQLGRLGSSISQAGTPQDVATAGRTASAVLAALTAVLAWLLAARSFRPVIAIAIAAAVAVSPTLVVHAHYLKEDALLTFGLLATLCAFVRFVHEPTTTNTMWLGVALGLAGSAHYKSALVGPILLAAPVLGALKIPGREALTPSAYYRQLAVAVAAAGVVWSFINWPALTNPSQFWEGATYEFNHALIGHDVRVTWRDYWLGFHFLRSLGPGMTWLAALVGLAGFGLVIWQWRSESFQHRLLVVFAVVFYLGPELSPLKPFPDFGRYVMPVVPVLLYFAGRLVADLSATLARPAIAILAGAIVVWPAYDTVRLVYEMAHDTRSQAATRALAVGGRFVSEQYGVVDNPSIRTVQTAADLDLDQARAGGVEFIITSSLMYDRYQFAAALPDQDPRTYERSQRYRALFALPYDEIAPRYRTFAFSNPTIRIIRLGPRP